MNADVILTCILSSSLIAALLAAIKEIVLWFMNRKAKVSDDTKEEEKEEREKEEAKQDAIIGIQSQLDIQEETNQKILTILDSLEKKLDVNRAANKFILKDRIKFIALSYIQKGSISFDDRQSLHSMWELYHYGLGGNGDLNAVMTQVDKLPLDVEIEEYYGY